MSDPLSKFAIGRLEFIILIAGLSALNALAVDVMLPALPEMAEHYRIANENDRQLVLPVYLIGFGIAQLVVGPISDAFGRRAPLLIGLVIYCLAALAAPFAPDFFWLLALRFLQGVGAAGTRVITQSVVRDVYAGRQMAEINSLIMMLFMAIPIIAPGLGQVLLFVGPWWITFLFMAGLGLIVGLWTQFRLPETLDRNNRRALKFDVVVAGFAQVLTNRVALMYGLAGVFMLGAMFTLLFSSQQVYVEIYELGPLFPLAFATSAFFMGLASYLNSRFVVRLGMRKISHAAVITMIISSTLLLIATGAGSPNLWIFLALATIIAASFSAANANFGALAMEPLGHVAGTAAAVFGFLQIGGGAFIGMIAGRTFNGTVAPFAIGCLVLGLLALAAILIAEQGKLFSGGQSA